MDNLPRTSFLVEHKGYTFTSRNVSISVPQSCDANLVKSIREIRIVCTVPYQRIRQVAVVRRGSSKSFSDLVIAFADGAIIC